MKSIYSNKIILLLIGLFIVLGFTHEKVQKKVIRNKEFDIHFYVLLEESETIKDKMYYWYKSGEIHQSYGGSGGQLLHLEYSKYFKNNQLAEKGSFYYGLKSSLWKSWYETGNLKEEVRWRNGEKNGPYFYYDTKGALSVSGKYNSNKKDGVWINIPMKDTTWYENGVAYKELPRIVKKRQDSINGKKPFIKRVWDPIKNLFKKKEDTIEQKVNKEPFFKRLFKRKKDKVVKQEHG